MRVWFRYADEYFSAVGEFEYVSDVISAIHSMLGKSSPSAVRLQVALKGRILSATDETAEVIPATVGLNPRKDVLATPIELIIRTTSPRRGSRGRLEHAKRPPSGSRPSSRSRHARHVNPVPSDSESQSVSTSCDDALLAAAVESAKRNILAFQRNPGLRGQDYIDRHVEKIAEHLGRLGSRSHDGKAEAARGPGEWVVMLCPSSKDELVTKLVPAPPRVLDRCLDVIRHLQRSIPDYLVTEAFYYDEALKDYVPLNDASVGAMTGLLFVLCKPHRALSLGLHQLPEAPRPDNVRSAIMMGEYINRLQGFMRGLEHDEKSYREQLDSLEHQQRLTLAMYEAQLHQAIDDFRRQLRGTREETPPKRRPWYEKVSPAKPATARDNKQEGIDGFRPMSSPTKPSEHHAPPSRPAPLPRLTPPPAPVPVDATPVSNHEAAPSSARQTAESVLSAVLGDAMRAAGPTMKTHSAPAPIATELVVVARPQIPSSEAQAPQRNTAASDSWSDLQTCRRSRASDAHGGIRRDGSFINEGLRNPVGLASIRSPRQLANCLIGGVSGRGVPLNEGIRRSDDAVRVRAFWYSIPNRQWSIGDAFFHRLVTQHPSLLRTILRGWDFVEAGKQLCLILESLLAGGLTDAKLRDLVRTAIANDVLSACVPLPEQYDDHFVSVLLGTLSDASTEALPEELQQLWERLLRTVCISFRDAFRAVCAPLPIVSPLVPPSPAAQSLQPPVVSPRSVDEEPELATLRHHSSSWAFDPMGMKAAAKAASPKTAEAAQPKAVISPRKPPIVSPAVHPATSSPESGAVQPPRAVSPPAPVLPPPVRVGAAPEPIPRPEQRPSLAQPSSYAARLTRFFERYCPEAVSAVDATLARVAGVEEALFARLVTQYGPEPPADVQLFRQTSEDSRQDTRTESQYSLYEV